jgi:hypothetical protein
LESHNIWMVFVLIVAVANFYLYEVSVFIPKTSTAPMALIEPARALFHDGLNPYSVSLFDGAPVSPGPGWIVLNAVFTLNGVISLLMPAYFFIANMFVAKWSRQSAFMFSLMLVISLNFLQLSVTGHDLPAFSLALVVLILALNRYHSDTRICLMIAVLTGIVATARIPFIIVPAAMGVCLMTVDRMRGIKFAVISTAAAILIHAVFFLWSVIGGHFYQPLHVFGRASGSMPAEMVYAGTFIWIVLVVVIRKRLTPEVSSWLVFIWVLLSIPFSGVGMAELLKGNILSLESWAAWEGKGYVMFTLPLLVAGLVLDRSEGVGFPLP